MRKIILSLSLFISGISSAQNPVKLDSVICGNYSNGTWHEIKEKYYWNYNDANRVSNFKYWKSFFGNALELAVENNTKYTTDGKIASLEEKWFYSSYVHGNLTANTYNTNQQLIEVIFKKLAENGNYENKEKREFEYSASGDTLLQKKFYWEEDLAEWSLSSITENQYDLRGELIQRQYEEYNLSEVNYGVIYKYYNSAKNLDSTICQIKFNKNSSYENYSKNEYDYDSIKNLILTLTTYQNEFGEWEKYSEKYYRYNDKSKCVGIEEYRIYGDCIYSPLSKSYYQYNPNGDLIVRRDSILVDGYGLVLKEGEENIYNDDVLFEKKFYSGLDGEPVLKQRMWFKLYSNEKFNYPSGLDYMPYLGTVGKIKEIDFCENETGICDDYKMKFFYSENEIISDVQPELEVQYLIYPNPANNILQVEIMDNQQIQSARIEIVNSLGQIVLSQSFELDQKNSIDVSMIPKGSYFLNILSNTHVYAEKFIKL